MYIKKFFAASFILLVLLMLCSVAVFADDTPTIEISSATIDSDGNVTLVCTVTDSVDEQQVSVMVVNYDDGTFDYDNIVYINQYDYPTDEDNLTVTFTIDVSSDKTYYVRVGGTDIAEAVYIVITDGTVTIIKGDVNNDGTKDIYDLVKIFNHIQGNELLEGIYLQAANINNDDVIDIYDLVELFNEIQG